MANEFDLEWVFSGTDEERADKASFFEVGVRRKTGAKAAEIANAVVNGWDERSLDALLEEAHKLERAYRQFRSDPRVAALIKRAASRAADTILEEILKGEEPEAKA